VNGLFGGVNTHGSNENGCFQAEKIALRTSPPPVWRCCGGQCDKRIDRADPSYKQRA